MLAISKLRIATPPPPRLLATLTPYCFVRLDSASNKSSTNFTLLTRHCLVNHERTIRAEEATFARKAMEALAPRLHKVPVELADNIDAHAHAWFRRTLKTFQIPESRRDNVGDERVLKLMVEFGMSDLHGTHAVAGALSTAEYITADMAREVNKTQARLKVGAPILEKPAAPASETISALRERKPNQPVRGAL